MWSVSRTGSTMAVNTQFRSWLCGVAGFAAIGFACGRAGVDDHASSAPPSASIQSGIAMPCMFRENGFRSGVNPPREGHRVEADLRGLPPLANEPLVIIEVHIDADGRVTESCLRRGVRSDVDRRVGSCTR